MVLYFTGTGNSRYVAERIARATGDAVEDISQYLKSGKKAKFNNHGTYVFVAPIYVSAPARALTQFIADATFPKGVRVYFVMTCAAAIGATPGIAKKLSKKKNFSYMGSIGVVMPQNYILYFKTKEKEENVPILHEAEKTIEEIIDTIKEGRKFPDKKMFPLELPITELVCDIYYGGFMKTKKFCATNDCIACGKCVKVCPFGNVSMKDGKPVWGKQCTHCMACINLCPKQAIEHGKTTSGKPRYIGPEKTLTEKN